MMYTGIGGYVLFQDWMRQSAGLPPMTEQEKEQMRRDIIQQEINEKQAMKLNLKDKEIQEWLETRDWIFHYQGDGEGFFAKFSPYNPKEEDIKEIEKCPDTGFPIRGDEFNIIDLSKEIQATYSMPHNHFEICSQRDDRRDEFPYSVRVHHWHSRVGGNYECVFFGYAKNLEEIKSIFRLLGYAERHLI